jgi:hypothetical protein
VYAHALISPLLIRATGTFEPRRRKEEDRWVVPHMPVVLLAWDGHANTEFGGSWALPVYLYKYFYKGFDTTRFRLAGAESSASATESPAQVTVGRPPVDEINDYLKARYLSAMEAAWRLANFDTSRKSPGVLRLPVHLPGRNIKQYGRITAPTSDASLLMRYLDRPIDPRLRDLTYIQFYEKCSLATLRQGADAAEDELLELLIPGRPRMRIAFRRDEGTARVVVVYPRHGDVFYLRCILMHRPAASWDDARTHGGILYPTYQEAARAMGLFNDTDEGELAFKELIDLGVTPAHLRWFFCLLSLEGPVLALWTTYRAAMGQDIHVRLLRQGHLSTPEIVNNHVLEELQDLLGGMGKQLKDIGLTNPVPRSREIEAEQSMWSGDPQDLHSFEDSLTDDQVRFKFTECSRH